MIMPPILFAHIAVLAKVVEKIVTLKNTVLFTNPM